MFLNRNRFFIFIELELKGKKIYKIIDSGFAGILVLYSMFGDHKGVVKIEKEYIQFFLHSEP